MPDKIGLFYKAFLTLVLLYATSGHWPLTALILSYLAWLSYLLVTCDKSVEGGENWSAIIIGAGFSGLDAGIKLKEMGVKFTILEKSEKLGGTWWDNQYPGAACDVPSHLYSLSYYLNPWWSRAYSRQQEIFEYLEDVAHKFGLYSHIHFNTRVEAAQWNEATSKWTVTTHQGGRKYEANFLIAAVGALHVPNDTRFKDDDKFKGAKFHTARWRHDVSLKGKKVAVVGTGASAVQVVPNIVDDVKELVVFQRTPAWVPERMDFAYPEIMRSIFAAFPFLMKIHRWFYFWRSEFRFYMIFDAKRFLFWHKLVRNLICNYIKKAVHDPETAEKLTPKYELGCKRITPSDGYLQSFNKSHVNLVTDEIERFSETGIVTGSKAFDFDVIIMATGFSIFKSATVSFRAVGVNGKVLQEEWESSEQPKAFKGIVSPGFPNMFYSLGPNTGLGHNTVVYMIECQNNYTMDAIRKLIKSGHKSMECRLDAFDRYHEDLFKSMPNRVFGAGGCQAWYVNSKGVNWTLWPHDLTHYWWITRRCQLSDFSLD